MPFKRTQFLRLASRGALMGVMMSAWTASLAQEGPSIAADDGDETSVLDTVIVQARKRDESIEDVPASVSAISGDRAEQLVLENVEDIVRQIPGGIQVASGPDYLDDIALRGQGGGRIGFSESTTGIYRDGMFVAGGGFGGRSFSRIDFFDMAGVEVYRGPQGALYGRNAVGGAVNVRTRRPEETFSARLKGTIASEERYGLEGFVNTPMAMEGAAVRVGGFYEDQGDGVYRNADTGQALDTETKWGARASLLSPVGETGQVLLMVEHYESEAPGFATLGQNLNLDPDPFTRVGLSTIDRVSIEQTSVFAEYTADLGAADLTVLGNYKVRDGDRPGGDLDHFLGFNTSLLDLLDEQAEEFDRQGLEMRLASPDAGSGFAWLVGVDYQTYRSDITSDRSGMIAGPYAGSAALRAQLRNDMSTEELDSYSLFGLVGFELNDRVELTLEGRIQTDDKRFTFERVDGDALTDETIPQTDFTSDSTRFLPTVSLTYALTEDSNLYGRIATGYRPGGFNPTPTPGFFDQTSYDPEDILSYEAGYKSVLRLGETVLRPQVSFYYSETEDVQATTNLSTTNTVFSLQNVGGNTVYGAEVELSAYSPVGAGNLLTTIGLSTTQGEWDEGTAILFQGQTVDLSGLRVPRTRDYIANINFAYEQPLTLTLDGMASLSFQTEGGGYDNATNTRSSESYEILDLSVGIKGDSWRLMVFGRNITDEMYRLVQVNNNDFYNTPQTFGVSVTLDY